MTTITDLGHQSVTIAANGVPDIATLREQIDQTDAEILRLIKIRTQVSRTIGAARLANGGPKVDLRREMDVFARFRDLGQEGRALATLLLQLGRGRLGQGEDASTTARP
jgi:chorismate mutase